MKESSRSSTDLFFPQSLPIISFRQFSNQNRGKDKVIRLLHNYREIIFECLAIITISGLFLAGTYLFCIQLAEHGW